MVKVLINFIVYSCFISLLSAQWLPNPDFENWKPVGITEEPESWGTLNQNSFLGGVNNAF